MPRKYKPVPPTAEADKVAVAVPEPATPAVAVPRPSVTVRTDANGHTQTITRPHEGTAFIAVEWL